MVSQQKTINYDNLPVIEENSLHRIVTVVKLYQEYKEFRKILGDGLGKQKFEAIYGNDSPEYQKTLEGVCYKKYYEGKSESERFGLVRNPSVEAVTYLLNQNLNAEATTVSPFLELGNYLKVDLKDDENKSKFYPQRKVVTAIRSQVNSFYWREWSFTEELSATNCIKVVFDFSIFLEKIVVESIGDPPSFAQIECTFKEGVNFDHSKFGKANFNRVTFKAEASFQGVQFKQKDVFRSLSSFFLATFEGQTSFKFATFKGEANFYGAVFENTTDFGCTFEDLADFRWSCYRNNEIYFNFAKFRRGASLDQIRFEPKDENKTFEINFSNITSYENIYLFPNLKENQQLTINLSESTLKDRFYFSVLPDTATSYENVTLNLYHTNFTEFICDDRSLHNINLAKTEESKKKENKDNKDLIEQAIAERRVFRKILQDLHWGDFADQEYAKIMDLQTNLEENLFKKWTTKFFFGWWFGWGVRILTWNPLKGGIVWSSILLLCFFGLISVLNNIKLPFEFQIYSYPINFEWLSISLRVYLDFSWIKIIANPILNLLNTIFSADAKVFRDLIIIILSFFQININLVILARKFMRL
jgi:uncharacterized protein YjbI with pentapeptide repeats